MGDSPHELRIAERRYSAHPHFSPRASIADWLSIARTGRAKSKIKHISVNGAIRAEDKLNRAGNC